MDEPRVYTPEEVQKHFLDQMWVYVDYWERESRTPDIRGKLEGLLHSILVVLDGESTLPAFKVIPMPHPDDKEFCRQSGENWYPNDCDICNVNGGLHNNMYKRLHEKNESRNH